MEQREYAEQESGEREHTELNLARLLQCHRILHQRRSQAGEHGTLFEREAQVSERPSHCPW